MKLQLDKLDEPAKPGVAFSMVKKLLAFNDDHAQRVEVVILSRNDPVSGMRVFRSAQHYGLPIERGSFTRGQSPWRYLKPLHANLFLSTHLSDVRAALSPACRPRRCTRSRRWPATTTRTRCASPSTATPCSSPTRPNACSRPQGLNAFQQHETRQGAPAAARPAPSSRCWRHCTGCSRKARPACASAPRWSRRAARRRTSAPSAR